MGDLRLAPDSKVVVDPGRDFRFTTAVLVAAVESVAVASGRDPGESWERLTHLGLVWEPSEPDLWELGIPLLCRFLVEQEGEPVLSAPAES